ncbi:MAG: glycerol-3-phosphate 1-O-acyltransferase PlsY [Verrucomicrobiae bacterium]|nr:glycerol-3-phosphate 1-O-acyltransferase PlsY [Verrucomicrobiae bacterium]NNJ43485.1 glycerol-3-phosphate 1-O-acyltransferase PlsY [Akkermansiaceae bacterium]
MPLWIPPLIAFLAGSIPFGLLIAKAKGVNIREHGSGNIGATNVLRVIGKPYGIGCLLLDFLKGFFPTLLAINVYLIAGKNPQIAVDALENLATPFAKPDAWKAQTLVILTGLAAILGHNYSPWIAFKGGKGIATSGGVLVALMPVGVVVLLIIWVLFFVTTRYVSIASMGTALMVPVVTLYGSYRHGYLADGSWNKPLFIFAIIIALLAVWRHQSNIKALLAGTEHQFSKKKK